MSLMRDWLGTTVERDLNLAALWKSIGLDENGFLNDTTALLRGSPHLKTEVDQVRQRHNNGDFDPDEDRFSMLKAASSRDVWPVQFVRLVKKSAPVQAVVSDGTTSVYAKFKAQSLQAFHRKYSKNFVDLPEGCLLRLVAFKILATNHGLPHDQVSLLVVKFEYLGLPQSPIGQPIALQERSAVSSGLSRLLGEVALNSVDDKSQAIQHVGEMGDITSPTSVKPQVHLEQHNPTQFATQAPPIGTTAVPEHSSNAILLSLVTKKPTNSEVPVPNHFAPGNTQSDRRSATRSHEGDTVLFNIQLKSPNTLTANISESNMEVRTDSDGEFIFNSQSHDIVGAQASQTSPKVQSGQQSQVAQDTEPPEQREQSSNAPDAVDVRAYGDPWADMTFPLPNSSVPKDQLAILARPFSWYPADPGRTFPTGNVPHPVLQWAEEKARHLASTKSVKDMSSNTLDAKASLNGTTGSPSKPAFGEKRKTQDESTVEDDEELPWEPSDPEDAAEDEIQCTIDPTPTMPSPLKPSPPKASKKKLVLPPDSSDASPQSPRPPQRVVLPPDSDDESMEFEIPHAQTNSTRSNRPIDIGHVMLDGAPLSTQPKANRDHTLKNRSGMVESSHSQRSHRNQVTSRDVTPPETTDRVGRPKSVIQLDNSDRHTEGDPAPSANTISTNEKSNIASQSTSRRPSNGTIAALVKSREDLAMQPSQPRRTHPYADAPTTMGDAIAATVNTAAQPEQEKVHQPRSTPVQERPRIEPSSPGGHSVRTPKTQLVNGKHNSPQTPKGSAEMIQSTYPDRSAQKRKTNVHGSPSLSPKRIKQGRTENDLNRPSSILTFSQPEQQREKISPYGQYVPASLPLPRTQSAEQPARHSVFGLGGSQTRPDSDSQVNGSTRFGQYLLNRSLAAKKSRLMSSREKVTSPAVHTQPPDASNQDNNTTSTQKIESAEKPTTQKPRRSLPWQSSPSSSSATQPVQRASLRQSPTPSDTHTPRLSGSKQWRRDMLATSARSSPQHSTLSTDRVARQTISQPLSKSSSQPAPRRSPTFDSAPNADVPPNSSATNPRRAEAVDGPVRDLHRDFSKLKSVERDLGTVEEQLKRKHTKRWKTLGWSL